MTTTMMKRSRSAPRPLALLTVVMGFFIYGCDDVPDESALIDTNVLQQELISQSVLADEQMVSEVRKQLQAEDVTTVEVVFKGRIDAGKEGSPWEPGKAAFVLTDAIGHEGESDHDPHECPFCSRNINDYLVMVSFLDDESQLIEVDSQELFGVSEKQMVFVAGTARIDPDDNLVYLDATKIYPVTDQ